MKKNLMIILGVFLVTELTIGIIFQNYLFAPVHFFIGAFIGILVLIITTAFTMTFSAQKELRKNIEFQVGKYVVLKYWNGLENTLGSSGEVLVITKDNKVYRLKIVKNVVVEKVLIGFQGKVEPIIEILK